MCLEQLQWAHHVPWTDTMSLQSDINSYNELAMCLLEQLQWAYNVPWTATMSLQWACNIQNVFNRIVLILRYVYKVWVHVGNCLFDTIDSSQWNVNMINECKSLRVKGQHRVYRPVVEQWKNPKYNILKQSCNVINCVMCLMV